MSDFNMEKELDIINLNIETDINNRPAYKISIEESDLASGWVPAENNYDYVADMFGAAAPVEPTQSARIPRQITNIGITDSLLEGGQLESTVNLLTTSVAKEGKPTRVSLKEFCIFKSDFKF